MSQDKELTDKQILSHIATKTDELLNDGEVLVTYMVTVKTGIYCWDDNSYHTTKQLK